MNHPPREDWVPYLFGETETEVRRQLREHLKSCPDCRAEIDRWKRALGRLDDWKLPRAARTRETLSPVFRWAFAGAVLLMLGLGYMVGRLTTPVADPAQLRAAIEPELRQEFRAEFARMMRQELATTAAATLAASGEQTKTWLTDYARDIDARLEAERTERISDCLSLKKDVDTLAINADAGFRHTQEGLALLAQYPQSPSTPSNNDPVHH